MPTAETPLKSALLSEMSREKEALISPLSFELHKKADVCILCDAAQCGRSGMNSLVSSFYLVSLESQDTP